MKYNLKRIMCVSFGLWLCMTIWAEGVVTAPGVGTYLQIGDIAYKVTSSDPRTVSVTYKYNYLNLPTQNKTYTGNVVIPKTVTYSTELGSWSYTVTGIDDDAFQYGSGMTALTIPNTVTSISSSAFTNATGLTSLTIEDGTTSLGISLPNSPLTKLYMGRNITTYGAIKKATNLTLTVRSGITSLNSGLFYGCSTLTRISIPETINVIETSVFENCTSLSSFTVPASVSSIGSGAFRGCTNLKTFIIEDGDSLLTLTDQFDNSAFSDNCPIDSLYLGRNLKYATRKWTNLTRVDIGDKVTHLIGSLFSNCTKLTNVHLGANVATMGTGVFSGCTSLESIDLSVTKLTTLPLYSFYQCSSLKSVLFPADLTEIQYGSFENCTSLSSFTVPASVSSIGSGAFHGCTNLKTFIIEDSDSELTMGDGSNSPFSDNCAIDSLYLGRNINSDFKRGMWTNLTRVAIGDKVTHLIESLFYGYTKLRNVHFGENITSMGEYVFSGCSSMTYIDMTGKLAAVPYRTFYNCKALESVILPANITCLGGWLFDGCSSLKSINIPGTVTEMGYYTFSGCSSLKEVIFEDGEDDLALEGYSSESTFNGCPVDSVYLGRNLKAKSGTGYYELFPAELTKLTISNSVSSQWDYNTFFKCTGLTKIYPLWEQPIATNKKAFPDVAYTNATLLVPGGTVKNYQTTSAWNLFTNIVPTSIGVKMTANEGGSVTLGEDTVSNGSKLLQVKPNSVLTFEIKTEDEYYVDSVIMNDTDVTEQVADGKFTPADLSEDIELTVVFAAKPYFDVTVTASTGGTATVEDDSVMMGRSTTVIFIANEGHELKSVTVNGEDRTSEVADGAMTLNDIQENMAVVAAFRKIRYAITAAECENGSIQLSAEEVEWGDDVTASLLPADHYELATVSVNGEEWAEQIEDNSLTVTDIRQDIAIAATFQLQTFTVTVTSNEGGTATLSAATVQWGGSVTLSASSDDEHYLENVLVNGEDVTDGVAAGQYTITSVEDNTVVTVTFKAKPYYDVTVTSSAGGTATVGSASVMSGRSTTVVFTANEGYELADVTVNGTDMISEVTNGVLALNDIQENISVVTTFRKLRFAITLTIGEGGNVSLSKEQPEWGDDITVTIAPDEDYELATLFVGGSDVTSDVINGLYVIENVQTGQNIVATFRSTVAFIIVPSDGQLTYCCDHDLDFGGVTGIKAYIASGLIRQTATVMMMQVTDVPAGTGLVVKGEPGTYKVPYTQSTAYYMNMLKGNMSAGNATLHLPDDFDCEEDMLRMVFGENGKKGDVNSDGEVNEVDAQMVLDYSVAKVKPW